MKTPFVDQLIAAKHGAGGPAMRALIESVFLADIDDGEVLAMDDGAAIPFGDQWLVVTTDAHVVQPIFFPGGDIGRLSVCGVVNDLAMMGACDVLALTSCAILEEGFPIEQLRRIHTSTQQACREAGAKILTGDTKVMGRGEIDQIVLSTAGIGVTRRVIRGGGLQVGDAIVITGTIGDHGLAVLSARHNLGLQGDLHSDVAPLNGLIRQVLLAGGDGIHALKDPTRGGVTAALAEMAERAGVAIVLQQLALPMSDAGRAAAELLGIDPLSVANEGKALIGVHPDQLAAVLRALHSHPLGKDAAAIGTVRAADKPMLLLDTGFGQRRLFEKDAEPLPRIC
jgi:hydrogenase expression/formation protein HypE